MFISQMTFVHSIQKSWTWTVREVNKVADYLTNLSHSLGSLDVPLIEFSLLLHGCSEFVLHDMIYDGSLFP